MNLNDLSKLSEGKGARVSDSTNLFVANPITTKFLKGGGTRVTDSIKLAAKASDRKNQVKRILTDLLGESSLNAGEIKAVIDSINPVIEAYELRHNRVCDSLNTSKAEAVTLNAEVVKNTARYKAKLETREAIIDSYRGIGTVESILTRITDSEEAKTIEDVDKKALADKEEIIKQLQADLEEAKNKQNAEQVADAAEDGVNVEVLTKLSGAFEDWIQTGSVMLAKKVKEYAEILGISSITTLVNKAVDYDVDQDTYDELVPELKSLLNANKLSIPSLSLITDSEAVEALKLIAHPVEEVELQTIIKTASNFILDPNDETMAKLNTYITQTDPKLAQILTDILAFKYGFGLEGVVKAFEELSSKHTPVVLNISPLQEISTDIITTDDLIIPQSTLTKIQFKKLTDSKGRLSRVIKLASKVKVNDCGCVSESCGANYPDPLVIPRFGGASPVEGTEYMSIIFDGVAKIFIPNEGQTSAEIIAKSRDMDYMQVFNYISSVATSAQAVVEVAEDLDYLDIVTDSLLYRRRVNDSHWVSEAMAVAGAKKQLGKLMRLSKSFITDSIFDGASRARFIVSKEKVSDSLPGEFMSIATKRVADIETPSYHIKVCLDK